MRAKLASGSLVLLMVTALALAGLLSGRVQAAPLLVQTTNAATSTSATSITATFTSAAIANNLLIAICGGHDSATITGPTGFTTAKVEAGTPSQGIFYKVAAGGETALTCSTGSTSMREAIQIYEYSGMATASPLDAVNAAASTGSSSSPSSGSVTTTNASDLLIAGVTLNANTSFTAWSNSFAGKNSLINSGSPTSSRATYGGADRSVGATGTYTTAATAGASGAWRGQIAAFKAAPSTLTTDIVDASGNTVASPSVAMSTITSKFTCQTVTGTLGTSSQKIRVSNTTTNPAWTLSIAATNGATSNWSAGTPKYDFNDPTSSGCADGTDADTLAGQLTVNPAAGTLTPKTGCTNTGVSLGASSAFNEGVLNSITLVTGSTSAGLNCYWDITGVSLSQTIPVAQKAGSYSLNLTLTVVAN